MYNRALAFRDQGKNAEAISDLDSVLSREPNNVGALYNLGNIFIAEGRTNDVTQLVNRAIELDPTLLQGK
jgi:tetratricopeptide (TPR) repeat protein